MPVETPAPRTPVLDRLRAMDKPLRVQAVNRLAEHGLLDTVEATPERSDVPGNRLTHKQQALWLLDHDGRHGDFYHCGALWFAPTTRADDLADAFRGVADGFDAFHRGVANDADGAPVVVEVDVPAPSIISVPMTTSDPHAWVREAVALAAREPIDVAHEPAHVLVYELPDESSAIGVIGHDLHLDEQGLWHVLGPAMSAHLTGAEPVREQLRISDVADWQHNELDVGVLGTAAEARRAMLRETPRCPLPVHGDRSGRRVEVGSGTGAWAALRAQAADRNVSAASAALTAWYRALRAWDPRTAEAPVGCCTTARMRPEFSTTLGNLTNTVVVSPAADWPDLSEPDLAAHVHHALTIALGTADLPFEAIFADEPPAQDEQIGVRFTFVEENPSADPNPLRPSPVQFNYAKSVLSCEIRVTDGVLEAGLDHRPAHLAPDAADELAALLRANLGFTG